MVRNISAVAIAIASDSMTHGPAMRKKPVAPVALKSGRFMPRPPGALRDVSTRR